MRRQIPFILERKMLDAVFPESSLFTASPVERSLPTPTRRNDPRPTSAGHQDIPASIECFRCSTRALCIPKGLGAKNLPTLLGVFGNSFRVSRGEAIFRAGDPFRNLYVARVGSSKTLVIFDDGREQITGFHVPGEFLGMEGISKGKHTVDAIALEDSVICAIQFEALEKLCDEDKDLRRHLHKIMSEKIERESLLLLLMGSKTAEGRVAAFLLNLSKRYEERGFSPVEFNLRMKREEIGCYLGLALETVSRALSHLQRRGLIEIDGKQTRILDLKALECV
ncbi:CRP/FNR family transcriptional regulator [Paraburkholderia youngii]|uniref:helix-turn-helix domain-containing protein n=1 Tax=Paraburkholderia youngii TaxID=2782701 RepID=UPI003D24C8EF